MQCYSLCVNHPVVVLLPTDDVMVQLKGKHPNPQLFSLDLFMMKSQKHSTQKLMVIWSGKLPCKQREQGVQWGSKPMVFIELLLGSLTNNHLHAQDFVYTMYGS